jgi:excisionase family DNA binding protein
MQVRVEGLEDHIERIVTEKVAAALSGHAAADPWVTAPEAADYLGIAVSTLHDLVCDGRLPRHGAKGHRLRFRREDLDAYARRD